MTSQRSMGARLSGNDVIAEMTSAEMTTDPGSEVKKAFIDDFFIDSRRPSWIYIQSLYSSMRQFYIAHVYIIELGCPGLD